MEAALRFNVTIGTDHRLELQLPADMPQGPAEVIVIAKRQERLTESQRHAIQTLLKSRVAMPEGAVSSTDLLREDRDR